MGTDSATGHDDVMPLAARKFRITGRVQGVFFRASTRDKARELGLGGYALNRDDGSVEVLASGSVTALDALERWLHDGPRTAQVSEVRASETDYRRMDTFETR